MVAKVFIILFLLLSSLSSSQKIYSVAAMDSWPPYYSLDKNSEPTGFAIEIFEEVAKKNGIKYHYTLFSSWKDLWRAVEKGEIDIIPSVGISKKRASLIEFSETQDTFPISIFARSASTEITNIDSLKEQKVVAVVAQDLAIKVLKEYPEIETELFDTLNGAIIALLSGDVDAIAYPETLIIHTFRQLGIEEKVVKVGDSLLEVKRAIGVAKNRSELIPKFNEALNELKKEGTFQTIYSKWFKNSKGLNISLKELLLYFVIVILIFLGIISLVIFVSFRKKLLYSKYQLERQVKIATESLEKIKNRYELLINTDIGLWDWDLISNKVYFTPKWKELIGFKDHELENNFDTFETRLHPSDRKRVLETIQKHVASAKGDFEVEFRLRHKEGHYVWILSKGKIFIDSEQTYKRFIGIHIDISRIKKYQEELREKDEMMIAQSRQVAMGEMISMIAHQWRQPITTIGMVVNNLKANILLEEKIEPKDLENNLDKMTELISHLSDTIDDFRDFFKVDKRREEISTEEVISGAVSIISKSIENNNIKLKTDIQPLKFFGYKRELIQVLINLLNNSKDALKEVKERDRSIEIRAYESNDYVAIEVIDNGGGIKEVNLSKIFEPYFTTKGPSYGTGLGLYMSEIIIKQHHGGHIKVENIDKGVSFKIEIQKAS